MNPVSPLSLDAGDRRHPVIPAIQVPLAGIDARLVIQRPAGGRVYFDHYRDDDDAPGVNLTQAAGQLQAGAFRTDTRALPGRDRDEGDTGLSRVAGEVIR